jgi:hypothetical protein
MEAHFGHAAATVTARRRADAPSVERASSMEEVDPGRWAVQLCFSSVTAETLAIAPPAQRTDQKQGRAPGHDHQAPHSAQCERSWQVVEESDAEEGPVRPRVSVGDGVRVRDCQGDEGRTRRRKMTPAPRGLHSRSRSQM